MVVYKCWALPVVAQLYSLALVECLDAIAFGCSVKLKVISTRAYAMKQDWSN